MKRIVKLTENDLNRIVRNSVKRILRESYMPQKYYVKIVECYAEVDEDVVDNVLVAVVTRSGSDKEAERIVQQNFPELEIIDVYDLDGSIDEANMTKAQYNLVEQGAVILPDNCFDIHSVEDLEWIAELNK